MNNRYARLASWVYNLDKPVGRSFGDVEYYRKRLEPCRGAVLEPAVGNGRVFVPLLEAGFAIEGFDASEEMLAYCREECRSRNLSARLTRQTFEDFRYESAFSAIVVPAGSFQLLADAASAKTVLRRFFDHLAPGGKLLLDLDSIGAFLEPAGPVRSWTAPDGDLLTLTEQRVETDHVAQTTLTHLRYDHWRDGRLLESELDLFRLRWWGVEEFSLVLRDAGFADVVVSGNYEHGRQPRNGDDSISFEAYRPA